MKDLNSNQRGDGSTVSPVEKLRCREGETLAQGHPGDLMQGSGPVPDNLHLKEATATVGYWAALLPSFSLFQFTSLYSGCHKCIQGARQF